MINSQNNPPKLKGGLSQVLQLTACTHSGQAEEFKHQEDALKCAQNVVWG